MHTLALLTAKTGAPKKGVKPPPFQWTPEMQKALDQIKASMAAEVLHAYPDHNKPFHIFTVLNLSISYFHVSNWPKM